MINFMDNQHLIQDKSLGNSDRQFFDMFDANQQENSNIYDRGIFSRDNFISEEFKNIQESVDQASRGKGNKNLLKTKRIKRERKQSQSRASLKSSKQSQFNESKDLNEKISPQIVKRCQAEEQTQRDHTIYLSPLQYEFIQGNISHTQHFLQNSKGFPIKNDEISDASNSTQKVLSINSTQMSSLRQTNPDFTNFSVFPIESSNINTEKENIGINSSGNKHQDKKQSPGFFKYVQNYRQFAQKISKLNYQQFRFIIQQSKSVQKKKKQKISKQYQQKYEQIMKSQIDVIVQKRVKEIIEQKKEKILQIIHVQPLVIQPSIYYNQFQPEKGLKKNNNISKKSGKKYDQIKKQSTYKNKPITKKVIKKNINTLVKQQVQLHDKRCTQHYKIIDEHGYVQEESLFFQDQSPLNQQSKEKVKINEDLKMIHMIQKARNKQKIDQKEEYTLNQKRNTLNSSKDDIPQKKQAKIKGIKPKQSHEHMYKTLTNIPVKEINKPKDEIFKQIQQINLKCDIIQKQNDKNIKKKQLSQKKPLIFNQDIQYMNPIQRNIFNKEHPNTIISMNQHYKAKEELRTIKREEWVNTQRSHNHNRRIEILDRFHYNPFQENDEDACQLWRRLMKKELDLMEKKLASAHQTNDNKDSKDTAKKGSKYKFAETKSFIEKSKLSSWIKDQDFLVYSSYQPDKKDELIKQQQNCGKVSTNQITKAFKRKDYLVFNDGRSKPSPKEDYKSFIDCKKQEEKVKDIQKIKEEFFDRSKQICIKKQAQNDQDTPQIQKGFTKDVHPINMAKQNNKRLKGRPKKTIDQLKMQAFLLQPIVQQLPQQKSNQLFFEDYFF